MGTIYCAWWNLENLFDIENYPDRSDKLQRTIGKELKGWTKETLELKLNNLSAIIKKMNNNNGPDILGVCEIENRHVLELLVAKLNRNTYSIIHEDSSDGRGIDIAFIYDKNIFDIEKDEKTQKARIFSHFIMKRTATRDILQVNFYTKNKNRIIIIGNHWPSRSGGELESEPYRIIAGETLAYYHARINEIYGDDVAIIVMGDFNDTPYNKSLLNYALSTNSKEKIKNAKDKKYFYNLMWNLLEKGEGTHYYNEFEILDQIMISEGIINGKSKFEVIDNSCEILKFNEMVKNGKPLRFSRPSDKNFKIYNGYSDHFPVSIKINE